MMTRWSKIILCLSVAAFAGLAAADNVLDYGANFAFVRHVMSMDTTFRDPAVMGRAITNPLLWNLFYGLIIAGEAATALLFAAGAAALWRARGASAGVFHRAKSWVHAGATAGFLVWFTGFMVVGGEWFQMWQSPNWNGQEAAFRFIMVILAVLIYVNQRDGEIGEDT